jgi:hypothetical protein
LFIHLFHIRSFFNSLKYAFREGVASTKKEVAVRLATQTEWRILEAAENEVRLPSGLDVKNHSSLGMRLALMFKRQASQGSTDGGYSAWGRSKMHSLFPSCQNSPTGKALLRPNHPHAFLFSPSP